MEAHKERTRYMKTHQSDRVHEGHVDIRLTLHEEIARRAYQLWEERDKPHGSPEEDWYHAEHELCHQSEVTGDTSAATKEISE